MLKPLDNDEQLADRLDIMQRQESTSRPSRADTTSFDVEDQECMSRTGLDIDKSKQTLSENLVLSFAFDKDLGARRVYRLTRADSWLSFPSSKGQSCG